MTEELELYTGNLRYKDIDFTFAFNKAELRMIPPKDKEYEIEWEWGKKSLGNGAFTWGDPIPVGVDFLVGECNETRGLISCQAPGSNIIRYLLYKMNNKVIKSQSLYMLNRMPVIGYVG